MERSTHGNRTATNIVNHDRHSSQTSVEGNEQDASTNSTISELRPATLPVPQIVPTSTTRKGRSDGSLEQVQNATNTVLEHRPNSSSSRRRHRAVQGVAAVNDWWLPELLCTLFGVACMAAIVAICAYVRDRPQSHWRSSISPNAMVSTLTTLSKISIGYALSESLSQLKWLYYHGHSRPLAHIDTFNNASQGPFGAVKFIWTMRGRAIAASFISLIVIVSLAFEPMAQQVFSYQQRLVTSPDQVASLPVAQIYDTGVGDAFDVEDGTLAPPI